MKDVTLMAVYVSVQSQYKTLCQWYLHTYASHPCRLHWFTSIPWQTFAFASASMIKWVWVLFLFRGHRSHPDPVRIQIRWWIRTYRWPQQPWMSAETTSTRWATRWTSSSRQPSRQDQGNQMSPSAQSDLVAVFLLGQFCWGQHISDCLISIKIILVSTVTCLISCYVPQTGWIRSNNAKKKSCCTLYQKTKHNESYSLRGMH